MTTLSQNLHLPLLGYLGKRAPTMLYTVARAEGRPLALRHARGVHRERLLIDTRVVAGQVDWAAAGYADAAAYLAMLLRVELAEYLPGRVMPTLDAGLVSTAGWVRILVRYYTRAPVDVAPLTEELRAYRAGRLAVPDLRAAEYVALFTRCGERWREVVPVDGTVTARGVLIGGVLLTRDADGAWSVPSTRTEGV